MGEECLITVCDKCLKSSCYNGVFMCDDSQMAGTIDKSVSELRKLDLEHEDWFSNDTI